MMRTLVLAVASLALASPSLAETDAVTAEIIEHEDGSRALVHEAVIDAPISAVWTTLSTAEGWKMWGPRAAWFDFRIGGTIETAYASGAERGGDQNIVHRILAYVPERMIALKLEKAPTGAFDPAVFEGTWGGYELEPLGTDRTKLRIIGAGYRSDEASTQMLEFFRTGNVYSINMLKKGLADAADAS